jgi:heavy metal sensor kinase
MTWFRTIRARLTFWYVLLLALTLAGFGFYLYRQLGNSLVDQIDTSLRVAASQASADIERDETGIAFRPGTDSISSNLVAAGYAARLVTDDGRVVDGIGGYAAIPAWSPDEPSYATLVAGDQIWRVYSQPVEIRGGRVSIWLQSAQSLETVYDTRDSLLTLAVFGLPLVLVVATLGGLFLADRALRPVDRITRTAQAISVGDLDQRIEYLGPADEIGRLAGTLDTMLDRLQAAFESERRFTADASHELRTPLTVIKGRIGVTLSRPRTAEEYVEALRQIEAEADRLGRLSNNLLFLARLEAGGSSWQPEPVDLADLLPAVVELIQPLAEEKRISVGSRIEPALVVQGDPDQLVRLFMNVLDNAVKYTPDGGEIRLWAGRTDGWVRVVIEDSGPGIPPAFLPHLFERFTRADRDRERRQGGAGLGLAIVWEIVRLHGGCLSAVNRPSGGAALTVELPALGNASLAASPSPQT